MVIDEQLWKLACQNAEHIKTMNGELGGVLVSLQWIKSIVQYQFWLGGGIFITVVANLFLTNKNGRK